MLKKHFKNNSNILDADNETTKLCHRCLINNYYERLEMYDFH